MRRDWNSITRIVEVRRAQRVVAEVLAIQARAARGACGTERDRSAQVLVENQQQWLQTLAEPSLRLDAARIWASAVQTAKGNLDRTELELVEAEAEQDRRNLERAQAMARLECSQTLAKSMRRRLTRQRDEAKLNEITDRDLLRRPR